FLLIFIFNKFLLCLVVHSSSSVSLKAPRISSSGIAIPCLATHRLYCIRSRIVVGDSRFHCFVTTLPDILNSLSTPAPVAGTAMSMVEEDEGDVGVLSPETLR